MKKKFIIGFVIAASAVCVIGYLARYTLTDIGERRVVYDEVSIYVTLPELSDMEMKLSTEQASLLYGRILEGKRAGGWYGVLCDDIGQHLDIEGEMSIVPKWCDKTFLWPIVWFTRNSMTTFYDPFF